MQQLDARARLALDAPLGAHLLQPDSRLIVRPGWYQVTTPSVRDGSLNEIVRCEELREDTVDAVIAREVERHDALGVDLKWVVGPTASPPDLADRLKAAGFTGWWAKAMAIRPSDAPRMQVPEGAQVEPVVDGEAREAWARVMSEGWGYDLARARGDALRAQTGGRHRLFVARLDQKPAGAAATFLGDGCAYLTGAVVLPTARGRGLYRALVAYRLRALAHEGTSLLATAQAREHSAAPILTQLGFETLFRMPVFLHQCSRKDK